MPHDISRPQADDQRAATNTQVILSFDMGGSHVAAMASPVNSPFTGVSMSVALHESDSAALLFDRIEDAAHAALSALTSSGIIVGIAVAMPGPFDYVNGISLLRHKFLAWYGVDVRKQLAARFGIDEENVVFLNDADAFLLGELHDSSASRAVGITLGTGVGAAFAIDGRAVPATEILPNHHDLYALPWKGSTVEEFISTRGIMRLHKERGGDYQSVKEIAEMSSADPIAANTMSAFGKELGLVIDTFLLPFVPDAIILGGSISRSRETFLPAVLSVNPRLANLLRISSHFEKAALLGSVAEWLRKGKHTH